MKKYTIQIHVAYLLRKKLTFLNYAQRVLSLIDIMLSTVHYQLMITRKMIWMSLTRELLQHQNEKDAICINQKETKELHCQTMINSFVSSKIFIPCFLLVYTLCINLEKICMFWINKQYTFFQGRQTKQSIHVF